MRKLSPRPGVLPTALAAAQQLYGPSFNPEITLKALSYFDDGDLRELPERLKLDLVTAVRGVDLDGCHRSIVMCKAPASTTDTSHDDDSADA